MSAELWAEHHQLLLWTIPVAISLPSILPQVRAFLRAVPRGRRVAVRAWREATRARLERVIAEPGLPFRTMALIWSMVVVEVDIAVRLQTHILLMPYRHMSLFEFASRYPQVLQAMEYLHVQILEFYVVFLAITAGFVLWLYRTPSKRLAKLQEQLEGC